MATTPDPHGTVAIKLRGMGIPGKIHAPNLGDFQVNRRRVALVSLSFNVMMLGLGNLIVVVMMKGTLKGEGSVVVVVLMLQECRQVFEVAQSSTGLLQLH